nr:MAK10-like protein [Tanacetum cinerariifolium]
MGDKNPIRTLGDYSKPSHEGYRNTIKLLEGNNVAPLRSDTIRLDPSQHGRVLPLVSLLNYFHREGLQNSVTISVCPNNIKESLSLKHGLVLRTYSKKSLIMALIFGSKSKSFMTMSISPQDEPLTNRPMWSHDTQYYIENPEQTFVEYASSRTDEAGGKCDMVKNPKLSGYSTSPVLSARSYPTEDPQYSTRIYSSINAVTICPKQPDESLNNKPEEEEREETNNPKNINTNPSSPPDPSSSDTEFVCTKRDESDVMFIVIIEKNGDSREEEPEADENAEA